MKKVLIINTTLNKGGAARVAYNLFENLNSDFNIFFAYGRGEKKSDNRAFYFGNKIEMFLHILLVRFLGLEGVGSYFSTKKLINFIKKEKFDLIHIHNLHGYYLNFYHLLKFIEKSNIPVIYTVHDEWPLTWLPAYSFDCTHCKSGIGICRNRNTYPKNYFPIFEKHMFNKKKIMFGDNLNMVVVSPSIWLKNNIENSFLNKFEIKVINNGIDINIFRPASNKNELRLKYNLPVDKKIILFLASNLNDKRKGINYIIEAAKNLKKEGYLFIGIGNGKIQGISNIKTLGYFYDKIKLVEIYSLSDIFCFASSAETFFLAAAEALSCGIPVVGFDIPVIREIINDKVGVLTTCDSESLATGINNLLNNKNRMIEMGECGRELIVNGYSKNNFCNNYKILYKNILKI